MHTNLVSRNVTINGRRTSLRLERANWEALDDICKFEGFSLHDLCTVIDSRREGVSRTSAVRAFIITYFRAVAAKCGAPQAGTASTILPELAARR
ncbi:MAG: ribbon-helix-helix domain-containing protein [Rhodospirillales bacterium]